VNAAPSAAQERAVSRLRLALVGDICIGRRMAPAIARRGPGYLFAGVAAALRHYDLRIGNLECALLDPEPPPDQPRRLGVHHRHGAGLAEAGFDALSLANNHSMDFGPGGLASTTAFLRREGITPFGAGPERGAASELRYLRRGGRCIALIGACDLSAGHAGRARPGVAPLQRAVLATRVREARATADLVVVSLHADLEFTPWPAPWRVRLCRWLVRQGADVVVQHHPHVRQGIESYRGGVIAYSLGNFLFGVQGNRYQEGHPGVDRSFILGIEATWGAAAQPRLDWHTVPVQIGPDDRPKPLQGVEAAAADAELRRLSAGLSEPRLLQRAWRDVCRRELGRALRCGYYDLLRLRPVRALQSLWWPFTRAENRRWLRGALRIGPAVPIVRPTAVRNRVK